MFSKFACAKKDEPMMTNLDLLLVSEDSTILSLLSFFFNPRSTSYHFNIRLDFESKLEKMYDRNHGFKTKQLQEGLCIEKFVQNFKLLRRSESLA